MVFLPYTTISIHKIPRDTIYLCYKYIHSGRFRGMEVASPGSQFFIFGGGMKSPPPPFLGGNVTKFGFTNPFKIFWIHLCICTCTHDTVPLMYRMFIVADIMNMIRYGRLFQSYIHVYFHRMEITMKLRGGGGFGFFCLFVFS